MDLVEAFGMIKDTMKVVENFRNEEKFLYFEEAKKLADSLDVFWKQPLIPGCAVHHGVVGVDSSNTNAVESYYRINFYYPALDAIIQDMNLRFG